MLRKLSLLKQSVCVCARTHACGVVLICEVLSVLCGCVVCVYRVCGVCVVRVVCVCAESGCEWCMYVLISVVLGDGTCVCVRQRCSIKIVTASRLTALQMKYTCTHIQQILASGNKRW